jgi:hypothetical protein
MVTRYRDITAKYKSFRRPTDPIYLSRPIKTFFNKFIKRGLRARAHGKFYRALTRLRLDLFPRGDFQSALATVSKLQQCRSSYQNRNGQLMKVERYRSLYHSLAYTLERLSVQIKLVYRRKGKKIHEIPVPGFRTRTSPMRFQWLYTAIAGLRMDDLSDRIYTELHSIVLNPSNSGAVRLFLEHHRQAFDNRADFEMRYK